MNEHSYKDCDAKIMQRILNRKLGACMQALTEALDGIEEFSHLFVVFWMHEISKEERRTMKVHPRGRSDMPLLGVFATRTPYRQLLIQLLNSNAALGESLKRYYRLKKET